MQKKRSKWLWVGFICILLVFSGMASTLKQDENQKDSSKDQSKIKEKNGGIEMIPEISVLPHPLPHPLQLPFYGDVCETCPRV